MRLVLCKSWFNDLTELIRNIELEVDNLTPVEEDLSRLSQGLIYIKIDYPNDRKAIVEITLDGLEAKLLLHNYSDKLDISITQFGITGDILIEKADDFKLRTLLSMLNRVEEMDNKEFSKTLRENFTIKQG